MHSAERSDLGNGRLGRRCPVSGLATPASRLVPRIGVNGYFLTEEITNVQSLNPLRYFARQEAAGQPSLDELRVRLERQGLSAEQVEARVQEIAVARENRSRGQAGGRSSLDELRARLQERGVDPTLVEEHVARQNERGTARPAQGRQLAAARRSPFASEARPSLDDLRSRLQERGLAEEPIADRIERIEAARGNCSQEGGSAGPDLDQVRSHLEERGLDEAQIQARLDRMSHRFGR